MMGALRISSTTMHPKAAVPIDRVASGESNLLKRGSTGEIEYLPGMVDEVRSAEHVVET